MVPKDWWDLAISVLSEPVCFAMVWSFVMFLNLYNSIFVNLIWVYGEANMTIIHGIIFLRYRVVGLVIDASLLVMVVKIWQILGVSETRLSIVGCKEMVGDWFKILVRDGIGLTEFPPHSGGAELSRENIRGKACFKGTHLLKIFLSLGFWLGSSAGFLQSCLFFHYWVIWIVFSAETLMIFISV